MVQDSLIVKVNELLERNGYVATFVLHNFLIGRLDDCWVDFRRQFWNR